MATDQARTTIETDRQELAAEFAAEHGDAWPEQFGPGSFGRHELLDRVSLVSKLLEEAVVTHPACVQKPEWYGLARKACDALNDLYQQVGAEHV
jgi:hypothetical protein